jgi:MFS transporter, PPP family, 3-phenylpropionic acid transporter
MPLYDGVLVTETKRHGLDYARVRMWSSVAFIGGTFMAGIAVDRYGPPWVLYVGAASIVLLAPCALLLPAAQPRAKSGDPDHAPFRVGELLRQRPFLLFLMACGFCQASHSVLYSFGTLTWRAAGIDDVTISALWAESVAVEIVLMLFGGWLLKRLGACGLIGLGLGAGLVRWTGMAFTTELPALVFLQALHACTFAACHLGAMAFLQRALPAHGAAIGQSLYYALGTGATQALVFQFSGLLYAEFGQRAFLGMVVVSAFGMVALVALARTWHGGLLVGINERPS